MGGRLKPQIVLVSRTLYFFFFFFYSFCKVFDLVISIYKGFMTPYVNLETVLIICTSSPFVTPSASHLK